MQREENFKVLLSQQRIITEELEKEISRLNSTDIVTENNHLKNELTRCKARLEEADNIVNRLTEENKKLKNLLYAQIYNEKLAILNAVNKRVEVYYQGSIQGEINRLQFFEQESRRRIDEMIGTLVRYRIDSRDEISQRLAELGNLLQYKISEAMRLLNERAGTFTMDRNAEYNKLAQEGVGEAELQGAIKKNNIESLIGLNLINKLGILFLIIGVIAAAQFTYFRLPEVFKGVFMFAGGAILLILGELLNRKKANVFSLGITSGGVAVLYVALAISYFGLDILPMYPALGICIAITVLSFGLSQRYHSQTIAAFSFVGGYLPIFSISADKSLVYSAMVYFIILNLLSLIIAFRRKWSVAAIIGFVFHVFGSIYIISLTLAFKVKPDQITVSDSLTALYIVLAFLIYTLVPLASAHSTKKKLTGIDIALLASNTYISALLLYFVFYNTGFEDFKGLLAVVFAAAYFLFGKLVGAKLPQEKKVRVLFYLTSFAFAVLIVPMQLDRIWLSLGWLVEGLLLLTYGILKDEKNFRRYGYIVSGLCLSAFLLFDLLPRSVGYDYYFSYKYVSITVGSLLVMAAYIYKKQAAGTGVCILKYGTFINLWFFMLYIITAELYPLVRPSMAGSDLSLEYLLQELCITAGLLLAYSIPKIRLLYDMGIRIISISIYAVSIFWLSMLNSLGSLFKNDSSFGIILLGTFLLIIINLLSILAVMDIIRYLVKGRKLGAEWYPAVSSVYFTIILTQNLLAQYHLSFTNFVISIIYIVLALSWIIFGFIKRYSMLRRFGLGMSFLAITKLFLVDLSFLTEGYRIISYFTFGLVLIAISFVYQYFSKRLEAKL